jgi:hypothetical protein
VAHLAAALGLKSLRLLASIYTKKAVIMGKNFKVLAGRYIPTWGVPVFIAAVHIPEPYGVEGQYYTENAFFVPDIHAFGYTPSCVSYNPEEIPKALLKPEKLLADEIASGQAALESSLFLNNRELYMSAFWSGASYGFSELNPDPLFSFRLRGMFDDQMKHLAQHTSCEELKEHLKKVLSYPVLKFNKRE